MKTYLLPETGNFYKANLHCHTTISDGNRTPEEIKDIYKQKGYSVVAFTDHNAFIPHNDLTDDDFLALNGMEVDVVATYGAHEEYEVKRCDFSLIALEDDTIFQPLWHRRLYQEHIREEIKALIQTDENETNYRRSYTVECISYLMQTARKKGFYVILNHPTLSREGYMNYTRYDGMNAIEMFNGSSIQMGHDDFNPRVYDDILNTGKRIYGVGADENHNAMPEDSRYSDSGLAWTMIKADKLDYRAITTAMEKGQFYSTEGPEIYEMYIEDDKLYVKFSEAVHIICKTQHRVGQRVFAEEGKAITEAVFGFNKDWGYFRIVITDKCGRRACTNAYFPENIM